MKQTIITQNDELNKQLRNSIKKYDNIAFAMAWASAGTGPYKQLLKHKNHIKQAVIGTHFYQTDPKVLRDLYNHDNVRFILQPSGVFHPKVIAVWDDQNWELFIGSANLTKGAFKNNNEIMLHQMGTKADKKLLNAVLEAINNYYCGAKKIDTLHVDNYDRLHTDRRKIRDALLGGHEQSSPKKSPMETKVLSMNWATFYKTVRKDPNHGIEERIELLQIFRKAFKKKCKFSNMPKKLRRAIAGTSNTYSGQFGKSDNCAWFGNMSVARRFPPLIKNNSTLVSDALDFIPIQGEVTKNNYDKFVDMFRRAFPNGGDGIGGASRLLSMKRPDIFVSVNKGSEPKLVDDFGISKVTIKMPKDRMYTAYWDDIIIPLQQSIWWRQPKPHDSREAAVWKGRAALVDAIYYEIV